MTRVAKRLPRIAFPRVVADRVKVDEPEAIVGEPVRTQPGTLGDPFRVVSLLPGVVSPFPVCLCGRFGVQVRVQRAFIWMDFACRSCFIC